MSKIKGASLIELVMVIAIVAVIFATAGLSLFSYRNKIELTKSTEALANYISLARQKAFSGEDGLDWGIHLEATSTGSFYSLFASSTYALSAEKEKVFLSKKVQFSDPPLGSSKNFIFKKNTGERLSNSATSTEIYLISSPAEKKKINVMIC